MKIWQGKRIYVDVRADIYAFGIHAYVIDETCKSAAVTQYNARKYNWFQRTFCGKRCDTFEDACDKAIAKAKRLDEYLDEKARTVEAEEEIDSAINGDSK